MKKLNKNQIGEWCTFCPPKTSRATYAQTGWHGQFCCDNHKLDLEEYEHENNKQENRLTEADSQTWKLL